MPRPRPGLSVVEQGGSSASGAHVRAATVRRNWRGMGAGRYSSAYGNRRRDGGCGGSVASLQVISVRRAGREGSHQGRGLVLSEGWGGKRGGPSFRYYMRVTGAGGGIVVTAVRCIWGRHVLGAVASNGHAPSVV